MDIEARFELDQIVLGKKKQGPSSGFNEKAKKRMEAMKESRAAGSDADVEFVTPEELWGERKRDG